MSGGTCCELDDFIKAMANETRQHILGLLQHGEMNVGELTEAIGLAQPTISHHLDTLRRVGLVFSRREGKQVFYRLLPGCVTDCCQEILVRFNVSLPQVNDTNSCLKEGQVKYT